MSKFVRLFFNRKKNASKEVAGAIEIVICLHHSTRARHSQGSAASDDGTQLHQNYRDLCPPAHALRLAKHRRHHVQGVEVGVPYIISCLSASGQRLRPCRYLCPPGRTKAK